MTVHLQAAEAENLPGSLPVNHLDNDASSQGQVTVKPGAPDATTIGLHTNLMEAHLAAAGSPLHLSVEMGNVKSEKAAWRDLEKDCPQLSNRMKAQGRARPKGWKRNSALEMYLLPCSLPLPSQHSPSCLPGGRGCPCGHQ